MVTAVVYYKYAIYNVKAVFCLVLNVVVVANGLYVNWHYPS
jgi:hypothetical protein